MADDQAKSLFSVYQYVKGNCCPEWLHNPAKFREWYWEKAKQQNSRCIYCNLPGDTLVPYGRYFREGRRGKRLEVDRINSKEPYSPDNCVLACYPCNNAKSDVFTYEEFVEIGKAICKTKCDKRPRSLKS